MPLTLTGERLAVALAGVALAVAVAVGSANAPLVTLGVFAATVLALLVLLNAEAVLLGFLMVLPWSELLDWPSETVSVVKLAGLVLVFAYLLRLAQNREPLELPGTTIPAALFVLLGGVALIASDDPSAGVAKWLSYVQYGIFFFIFVQLVRTRASIIRVLRAIVISASLAALWGFVAFLEGNVDLASGPISDPNDFGYLLAVVFPLAVFLAIRDRGWRPVWVLSVGLLAAAMLATLSRGVAVSFLVLAIWGVAFRKVPVSLAIAVATGAVGIAVVVLLFWSPLVEQQVAQKGKIASDNVASRGALWSAGLEMAADQPLTGVGLGRFGVESKAYINNQPVALENPVAHNSYVEILAEGGFPSLLAFLAFLAGSAVLVSRSGRISRRRGDGLGVALATTVESCLLLAVVGGMFVSEQTAVPFWLAAGLCASVYRAARGGPPGPSVWGHSQH
jgi:O-antigen ligase